MLNICLFVCCLFCIVFLQKDCQHVMTKMFCASTHITATTPFASIQSSCQTRYLWHHIYQNNWTYRLQSRFFICLNVMLMHRNANTFAAHTFSTKSFSSFFTCKNNYIRQFLIFVDSCLKVKCKQFCSKLLTWHL